VVLREVPGFGIPLTGKRHPDRKGMKMRRWEAIFSEQDRAVIKKAGFGARQEFGERPALLIIDANKAFVGSQPRPILESLEESNTSCGASAWEAIEHIRRLLGVCRAKGIPVFFTTLDIATVRTCGGPTKTIDKFDLELQEIVDAVRPLVSELIIRKTKASGFFGTPLLSCLRNLRIDCLLIAGVTTSGCVRATVIDAFSHNFTVFVVEECTFDRFELSHLVNLWDMDAKYASVISIGEAVEAVERLT
jgi:nicotinamidase-related amidase